MAKVLYGGGVANMSGSEAGTVHSHNKGGTYTRQRVVPTNPQTARQMAQRDRLGNFARQWVDALDANQREAWNVWAQENPVIDRLGQSIFLSGFQAYVKLNNRIAAAYDNPIDDPPLDQIVTQLTLAALTFDIGIGGINISFQPTPLPATDKLQIFATPAVSAGVSYVKNKLRLVLTGSTATVTPQDFGPEWQDVFGSLPPVGRKVVTMTRVIRYNTGAVCVPVRSEAIVDST